jgi:ribose/xylose/arabinose/galactoside ABC-type transport system permease subunit
LENAIETTAGPSLRTKFAERLKPVHLTMFMIVVLGIALSVANPNFLTAYNVNTIISFGAILLIVALGQMFAILIGGIDLSVGGIISLVSVMFVLLVEQVGYFAFPICLVVGVLLGCINGLILTLVKIPSFIATLGTGGIITSLAYLVSPRPVSASPDNYRFYELIDGKIFGLSTTFFIGMAVLGLIWAFLRFTTTGRSIYYIGSNIRMAWMSGTDIMRNRCIAFMFSGGCAAIVGIVISSIRYGGDPVVGNSYVLSSIAAVVVGGTALTGGTGGVANVLFGALFLSLLDNGMNVVGIDQYFQQALLGAMIVFGVAVTFDRSKTPIIK